MKKENLFLSALGILVIGSIVIISIITANKEDSFDRLDVTGLGAIYAKADIANLTVGLKTETSSTAAEATTESTKKMSLIIEALKSLGIDEKDIKTTNYNLRPVYDWKEDEGQTLEGYQVSQNVNIKIRNLDQISQIITETTEKGANQIGEISFTIDDEYNLKNKARELAIEKAKDKAEMIAKQTGIELGKIKSVYEYQITPSEGDSYANIKMEALSSSDDSDYPYDNIQSGQNEIKVEVTLTYEVK